MRKIQISSELSDQNSFSKTPWSKPLATRKSEASAAIKSGKKLALMLYPDVDLGSSFRYRGYNIYQATKKSKKWQLVYFFPNELDTITELLKDASLLILGRFTKWLIQFDELAYAAHRQGTKVVLDLDDCVCGASHIKEMFNVVSPDVVDQGYWINASANLELISQLAEGFIVTNDYLGKTLSASHQSKPYQVIKNFLNEEQIAHSAKLLQAKAKPCKHEFFTLGYFSGSHTHATDFEVVYPELLQLLAEYSDIKLRIVGMLKLPDSATPFIKNGQIEYLPLTDFLSLQKLVAEVDVNLAPLADNVFANCKSELKFFEASLVQTPTVASPTFAFSKSIKNTKTGFLCRPGEWYDAILKLYQDPSLRYSIAEKAYAFSLENYSPTSCLAQIEKAFDYYAS